jgi:hypothetical protein
MSASGNTPINNLSPTWSDELRNEIEELRQIITNKGLSSNTVEHHIIICFILQLIKFSDKPIIKNIK